MRILTTIGLACAMSAAAFAASAQDIEKAVKARKAVMTLYAHYIGVLGGMAKGQVEYDAEKASAAAGSLAAMAKVDQSRMWPQGSSTDELGDATAALPTIWTTYPAIMEKAKGMTDASAAMAAAAGGGLDSLRGAMGDLGGACGACHKDFRLKKE